MGKGRERAQVHHTLTRVWGSGPGVLLIIRYVYILLLFDWLSVASSLIGNLAMYINANCCCIIHRSNLRYMILFHHRKHFILFKVIALIPFTWYLLVTRRRMLPPVPVSRINNTTNCFRTHHTSSLTYSAYQFHRSISAKTNKLTLLSTSLTPSTGTHFLHFWHLPCKTSNLSFFAAFGRGTT